MKIDIEMVLLSHKLIIESTGGSLGVRDLQSIKSVIENVYTTFDGCEVYPTKEDKASYLLIGLIKAHGFIDGNKRIGVNTLLSYLNMNGIRIETTNEELERLGSDVASADLSKTEYFEAYKEKVKNWIINHKKERC